MVKLLYKQKHGYNVAVFPDDHEPPHVHVTKDRMRIRIFLDPVEFGENNGFTKADLRRTRKRVRKHRDKLLEKRVEYHGVPGV